MLNHDQDKRLSIPQIVQSPWLTDNGKNPVILGRYTIHRSGKGGFGNVKRHIEYNLIGRKSQEKLRHFEINAEKQDDARSVGRLKKFKTKKEIKDAQKE